MSNVGAESSGGGEAVAQPARKSKQVCVSIPRELRQKLDEKQRSEGYKSLAAVVCRLLTTHPEMQAA